MKTTKLIERLLKQGKKPRELGLVSMMDGWLCPNCGGTSHQLLSSYHSAARLAGQHSPASVSGQYCRPNGSDQLWIHLKAD